MATKKVEPVATILPVVVEVANIRIVGDTPLIVHAWSEKAKRQMLETQHNKTKNKAKEARRPFAEFVDSLYPQLTHAFARKVHVLPYLLKRHRRAA